MSEYYDEIYRSKGRFWGEQPTSLARRLLEILSPEGSPRLLEIGCGEGRDSIFFVRNGYKVTAFDISYEGVRKTQEWADKLNLSIDIFQADLIEYQIQDQFDIIFSSGTLQYIQIERREGIITNYKKFTNPGGINAFTIPVYKPFIPRESFSDNMEHDWISGEIMTHYHDWMIEFFIEQILEDNSGDKFTVNRLIARNPYT